MWAIVLRRDWIGWASCALGAVLLAILANVYIFLAKPFGATQGIPIETTGSIGAVIAVIVPFVWLFLFAGMGTTLWLILRQVQRMSSAAWLVVGLIALCVFYPVYTGALNEPVIALMGNIAVILAAALGAAFTWPLSRLGALLLLPTIGWVALASVALVALISGLRF